MSERRLDEMSTRLHRLERDLVVWRIVAGGGTLVATLLVAMSFGGIPKAHAARQVRKDQAPTETERPKHDNHERVPEEPREPLVVAKDRRDMSFQALEMINRTGQRGNPVANQPMDIYLWSVRMLGAEIYLSMADGETRVEDPEVYLALPHVKPNLKRREAFQRHWDRMKAWEDRLRPLARTGVISRLGFLEFEFRRLQAELWLAREVDKEKKTL